MIKLEDYSQKELKKIAIGKGLTNVHNLSKPTLIKMINDLAEEKKIESPKDAKDTIQVGLNLSHKAMQWRDYLTRINIAPEAFLQRFPSHIERQYIEELLPKPSTNESAD